MSDEARDKVAAILGEAADAHHVYEEKELGGKRDQQWPAWYARYAIEHGLGDVASRTPGEEELAWLLEESSEAHDEASDETWAEFAAAHVVKALG